MSCCKLPVNWVTSCWCPVASFRRIGSLLLVAGVLLQVPRGLGHLRLLLVSCCKLQVWVIFICCWCLAASSQQTGSHLLVAGVLLQAPSELGHLSLVSCCKLPDPGGLGHHYLLPMEVWVASSWRFGSPLFVAGVLLQAPSELDHLHLYSSSRILPNFGLFHVLA